MYDTYLRNPTTSSTGMEYAPRQPVYNLRSINVVPRQAETRAQSIQAQSGPGNYTRD